MKKRYVYWFFATLLLIVLLAGTIAWMLFFTEMSWHVTISKETTYHTEPLLPDGQVDYVAALNKVLGRDITPEKNALIPFARVFGLDHADLTDDGFKKYAKLLGVTPTELESTPDQPKFLDRFQARRQYFKRMEDEDIRQAMAKERSRPDASSVTLIELIDYEYDEGLRHATDEPWTADQYPFLAWWLAQNEKPLAMITRAASRPQWFDPFIVPAGGDFEDRKCGYRWYFVGINDAIEARIYLRIGEGRLDEAWQDMRTIMQLPEIFAPPDDLPHVHLFAHPDQTESSLRSMIADLQTIDWPRPDLRRYEGNRIRLLAMLQEIPKSGPNPVSGDEPSIEKLSPYERAVRNAMRRRVDWDEILRRANRLIDEFVTLYDEPARPARVRKAKALLDRSVGKPPRIQVPGPLGGPVELENFTLYDTLFADDITDQIFDHFIYYNRWEYLLSTEAITQLDKLIARRRLIETAARLALYQKLFGDYPEQLDAVFDERLNLPAPPADLLDDPFAETDRLRYEKEAEGYLLYSIGRNGRDDAGRSDDERLIYFPGSNPHDDISIRVGPDGFIPLRQWNPTPKPPSVFDLDLPTNELAVPLGPLVP